MTLRPQTYDPPGIDEVSLADLFAGIRTVAELNAMIRAGLAAARQKQLEFSSRAPAPDPCRQE